MTDKFENQLMLMSLNFNPRRDNKLERLLASSILASYKRHSNPLAYFYQRKDLHHQLTIMKHIALNKSSLFLEIQKQNTQSLLLFTMIIKTESIYKSN
jgi:hypothetical protein